MAVCCVGSNGLSSLVATFSGLLLTMFLTYRLGIIIYRLLFHPLAGFPGPKLYAISYLPYLIHDKIRGRLAKDMLNIHQEYGPIVRISPNRLAVDGSIGWSEIFGSRGERPEFGKTMEFYGLKKRIGLFPTDKNDHRRQRRLMSHAFSNAALQEQEVHIKQYVDLLISQLHKSLQSGEPADIARWYNYTTFDIIGELAFGDPFYSLANSEYHPWVALIYEGIKSLGLSIFLNHYVLLKPFIALLFGTDGIRKRQESVELARTKTEKRLLLGDHETRKDFMTYILRHNTDEKGMTHEEILVNARALITAGSETTSTALTGLTFHLGTNLSAYSRVVGEIRAAFSSEDKITMRSTAQLPYLQACIEEALRIYPPAVETPPRISPGEFVNGRFVPKGTYLTIYQWATHHSLRNFKNPDLFVPERWLPSSHPLYNKQYSTDNKAACRPFSFGPRDCLGKNLAYSEMRLIITRLLWNFDFELLPGQRDWVDQQVVFTVYQKGPLMVSLVPAAAGS